MALRQYERRVHRGSGDGTPHYLWRAFCALYVQVESCGKETQGGQGTQYASLGVATYAPAVLAHGSQRAFLLLVRRIAFLRIYGYSIVPLLAVHLSFHG